MCGYIELRTARIWTSLAPSATSASIAWWPASDSTKVSKQTLPATEFMGFKPLTFTLNDLAPGTKYNYSLTALSGKSTSRQTGSFATQPLWQWRTPAPDFSFLTGSCAYFNEPAYDRPGTPYGLDSSIFLTMSRTPADFMLWLGDNWYTREADYYSPWGLAYRAEHTRRQPVLQPLLKAMPHYAIWDDHDFGPNDFGASYLYTRETRDVFGHYWANPSLGFHDEGIYTQFAYSDVAFFLLDDRTWRSSDAWADSASALGPDTAKHMLGRAQLTWLKDALLNSRGSTFKIIALGSQVLNPLSPYDCFRHFEAEFTELLDFLKLYKISGVVFLTGDRHHSEVISMPRVGAYTLYDITCSPLTSHVYAPGGPEKEMPERVPNTVVSQQNFGLVSVSGPKGSRVLKVSFLDIKGTSVASWQVGEVDLK